MNPKDCFVCQKHENPETYFGVFIAAQSGLTLTHFPFLAVEKATKGHLLIETRRHIADLSELNEAEAAALGVMIKVGAQLLRSVLNAEHVYVFRINDKVAHLHFHLVPRYAGTPREFWGTRIMEWPGRQTANLSEICELSDALRTRANEII